VTWQLLQVFGTAYVGNVVKDAGATYGVFALVLGLFAWIFLAAVGIVIGAEINVVRVRHLYPRALMTPFTDDVDLTSADQRAYTDAARAQQFKGFETVNVEYEDDGQHATRAQAQACAGTGGAGRRRVLSAGDAMVSQPSLSSVPFETTLVSVAAGVSASAVHRLLVPAVEHAPAAIQTARTG
jgi:hypothetical protein